MAINLVVVIPFGPYAKGDAIAEPALVAAALESNASFVVKVSAPDPEPMPEPEPARADPGKPAKN